MSPYSNRAAGAACAAGTTLPEVRRRTERIRATTSSRLNGLVT
jgi:hypothetical protein